MTRFAGSNMRLQPLGRLVFQSCIRTRLSGILVLLVLALCCVPAYSQDALDVEVSLDEAGGVDEFVFEDLTTELDAEGEKRVSGLKISGERDLCWRPGEHERRQVTAEVFLLDGVRDRSIRWTYTQYAERMGDDDIDIDFFTVDGLPKGRTEQQWFINDRLLLERVSDQVKPLALDAEHTTYTDLDIEVTDEDFEMHDALWRIAYIIIWTRVGAWIDADKYCLRCEEMPDTVQLHQGDAHDVHVGITDWKGDPLEGVELTPRAVRLGAMVPEEAVTDEQGQSMFTYQAEESGLEEPLLRVEYSFYSNLERMTAFEVSEQHAVVDGTMSMPGLTHTGRMYSCHGIGGIWYMDWELHVDTPEVKGTLSGGGSFTFPDEPVHGDTERLRVDMSGTLDVAEGGTVEFEGLWEYTVVLLEDNGQYLLDGDGDVFTGSIQTTVPGFGTITVPMSMPIEFGDPRPVEFVDQLDECEELPLQPLVP